MGGIIKETRKVVGRQQTRCTDVQTMRDVRESNHGTCWSFLLASPQAQHDPRVKYSQHHTEAKPTTTTENKDPIFHALSMNLDFILSNGK